MLPVDAADNKARPDTSLVRGPHDKPSSGEYDSYDIKWHLVNNFRDIVSVVGCMTEQKIDVHGKLAADPTFESHHGPSLGTAHTARSRIDIDDPPCEA